MVHSVCLYLPRCARLAPRCSTALCRTTHVHATASDASIAALLRAGDSSPMDSQTLNLLRRLQGGDRAALARAITLVESSRSDHRAQAEDLLDALLHARTSAHRLAFKPTGTTSSQLDSAPPTFRIGFAGPPGAGKSTLIESLGVVAVAAGHRVAVIAVDPSSSRSGGSILGDITRMPRLATSDAAFVRGSPTRGTLGGVAEHTNDVILLAEGAGYDVILVESVGLGQSEIVIDAAVDMLLLLVPPGSGDELQGSKKGIVEVADLVAVTKADGPLLGPARHIASDYAHALQLVRPKHGAAAGWTPPVHLVTTFVDPQSGSRGAVADDVMSPPLAAESVDAASSSRMAPPATVHASVANLWGECLRFRAVMGGRLAERRRAQAEAWMWGGVDVALAAAVRQSGGVEATRRALLPRLFAGEVTPRRAAAQLAAAFARACAATVAAQVRLGPGASEPEA